MVYTTKNKTMARIKRDIHGDTEHSLARLRELRKYQSDEPLRLIWEKFYKQYGMTYEQFNERLVSKEEGEDGY